MNKTYYIILLGLLLNTLNVNAQFNAINDADLYLRQGNFQAAIDVLTEYIEINPADAEAYIKRATAYEIMGQVKKKEDDLRYANYLNPFSYLYVSKQSRSRIIDKKKYGYDYNSDSESYKKSPVKNKYYNTYLKDNLGLHAQDSLLSEAIYFLSENDLESTEAILAEIDVVENIKGIMYDLYGLIDLKKDNLDEAVEKFTLSIEYMPNFPLAYHNRAIAHKLLGNYEDSRKDLMTAISLNEDISVFYFTLAKLSERLENPNEAINYYQEAIDKNPEYIEARTNYSTLQKTLGNYDEAIVELEEIANTTENKAKSHFILGGFYLMYGEYEDAISEFDKYLIDNGSDSDALFNRGLSKILMGAKRDGCEDLSESIDIKSNQKRQDILNSFCPNY